jgi:hypothetical protein
VNRYDRIDRYQFRPGTWVTLERNALPLCSPRLRQTQCAIFLTPALLALASGCGSSSERSAPLTFDLIEDSGADPPVADSGTDADADAAILHDDAMDAAALPDSGFCSGELGPLTAAQAADAGGLLVSPGLCVPCICPGGGNGPGSDASGSWAPNFACEVPNGASVVGESSPDQ